MEELQTATDKYGLGNYSIYTQPSYDTHVLYYIKYELCSSRPSPASDGSTATRVISRILYSEKPRLKNCVNGPQDRKLKFCLIFKIYTEPIILKKCYSFYVFHNLNSPMFALTVPPFPRHKKYPKICFFFFQFFSCLGLRHSTTSSTAAAN